MTRASKPRTQPRIKGRFASASDAQWVADETRAQAENKIAATLPKKPTQDRFKDAALAVRKTQTKGRRDSGARTLAKATGRQVTHRTFRSADAARKYLDKLKGKKSKLAWWGVSAKDEEGTLFAYQLPVSTPDMAGIELDNAQKGDLPTGRRRDTDLKVKESVRSADTRITVSVLNLNPPKKEASNGKAKAVGSGTRSKKPEAGSKHGSGAPNKPSGKHSGSVASAGSRKRASGTRKKPTRNGKPRTDKRGGAPTSRNSTKRGGKTRRPSRSK